MATDYDSPRKTDDDLSEDSLQELQARRADKAASIIDEDLDAGEVAELPGADLSNEELTFRVVPRQADEFTCTRCFLVHHRSQLAGETLVVAAIEVKLIAELHEVYGVRVEGSGTARGAAFLTSWARQRGINPLE